MTSWISIIAVVVAVLALGAIKERWRIGKLQNFCRLKLLTLHTPFAPEAEAPILNIARRFNSRGARRWGIALSGQYQGHEITIAEHETSHVGKSGKWHTLVIWNNKSEIGPFVLWPKVNYVPAGDAYLSERLASSSKTAGPIRNAEKCGFLIDCYADDLELWPGADIAQQIKELKLPGAFLREPGFSAWRMDGMMSPAQVERMLEQLPELFRLLS